MDLQEKNILVGVTGSIAAYKVAQWVHELSKEDARVTVVMTESAARFVSPLTFSALSGNHVHWQMFNGGNGQVMDHIALARQGDLILVAPATAQTISRCAHGMADTLLASVILAARCPVIFCPAMNTQMYEHAATQDNLKRLRELGYTIVDPDCGLLACGEQGAGRLASWDAAREAMLGQLSVRDLAGRKVLITAGPTREAIDPVRFLSNRSSGRMGYALARTALRRGAEVVLISGPVNLPAPPGARHIQVTTAQEMLDAVLREKEQAHIVVKAAAVADFRPAGYAGHKLKKKHASRTLALEPTTDILRTLGEHKRPGQILVGFAAESEHHLEAGRAKLEEKNLDLVVINDILNPQCGFDSANNQVALLDRNGSKDVPLQSKESVAHAIWDKILSLNVQQTSPAIS